MLDLDSFGFSGSGFGISGFGFFWIFQDLDLTLDLDFVWIFRIWIWTFGFGFGFFRQDIGVDRDVKMLILSAVQPVFRAPVVFLRRLVFSSGFSDFDDFSSGFGLLTDLIQM